ncbi:NXPE family member 3-like isoform X3 [Rana temporaria]|uniref:NXPE family member 3-like isoform X3 n=1 Tax=Rana temporaria TaxID=8407 RepID=UPI001AAD04D1|nr:NXPE family member 3-like isoform X3 [Rana temporaria]
MRNMRKPGVFLCALVIIFFMGFIIQILWRGSSIVDSHPAALETTSTPTSPPTSPVIGPQSEELTNLLKMIEWPLAPTNVSLEFSTYPKTSEYFIINPRATYMIGESLEVLIIAKDHKGRTKNYGGDYFHVKLHSLSLKAGVSGSVTDHNNGSYTARFILQWSGETMISVRLMHSSELIAILHQQRDTRPDKVFFKGYFEKNGIREVVECNFDLPGQDVCEYYDRQNQEKWVCQRPKNLPCDSYRDHSSGGNRKIQSEEEKPFFSMSLIDQEIPSNLGSLNVLPLKNVTNALKQINLHVIHHNPGPLLATDAEFNYLVQWRAHQKPLRMERSGIQELRYISSELDRLGNRKGMIIVITCWSHFLTYPVGVYIHRLHHIREAVVRLLERSPETTILIKSANTGYRFDHGSDWLSVQLDILMRAMFSKLPVTVLDVWQMTSCHREPENLHPIKVIIKNEVDLMLSFICPH